ncbi:MAG: DUF3365 domain-containing protein [Chitinophagaceae bacterium]|nr:DUF3365 domain-containing protein [Chitinophagaceae bacterium]
MKYLFIMTVLAVFIGCGQSQRPLSDTDKQRYLAQGDSIATEAQKALIAKLSQAIQGNGVEAAVEFCSMNALPLTDSLSRLHSVAIQRLSERNRNPQNAIRSEIDRQAWAQIEEIMQDANAGKKHLISQDNDKVYYYKAITIAMPTCLSCHGNKEEDIKEAALTVIKEKYPQDLATGYRMGDLRGMWKIAFPENE